MTSTPLPKAHSRRPRRKCTSQPSSRHWSSPSWRAPTQIRCRRASNWKSAKTGLACGIVQSTAAGTIAFVARGMSARVKSGSAERDGSDDRSTAEDGFL